MNELSEVAAPKIDLEDFPDHSALSDVEASLLTDIASVRIVRFHLAEAPDYLFRREDRYWLDLSLTPRPVQSRACFPDIWGPHRFETLGELFLVPPGKSMRVRGDSGIEQVSIICEIASGAVDRWLDGPIDWSESRLETILDMGSQPVRFALARLAYEARNRSKSTQALAEALTRQLAIEIARFCQALSDKPLVGGLAAWRLRLIDERIRDFSNPPDLEELADLCSMSKRQLTRAFRASRGCSLGDYMAQARLDKARRMLVTDENIKSIAYSLGFASPSAFSTAFRRLTGLTPRQFRQRQLRSVREKGGADSSA